MRWVECITGQSYRLTIILTGKIGGAGKPGGALSATNLSAALTHVLKGAEPDSAAAAIGTRH